MNTTMELSDWLIFSFFIATTAFGAGAFFLYDVFVRTLRRDHPQVWEKTGAFLPVAEQSEAFWQKNNPPTTCFGILWRHRTFSREIPRNSAVRRLWLMLEATAIILFVCIVTTGVLVFGWAN